MYLSVPRYAYSVVLVLLDSVQNVTIWLQMRNSSGSKLVTNACYLYCLCVKVGLDALLLVRAPFSRDIVFALYFILSAFTFTRIAGIPFKRLKLFKGMVYSAAVFTVTMITSAMAFGQIGPFSLYCFLIGYAVYATHCKKSALRESDAQRRNQMGFGFAAQSLRLQSRGAQFADAQIAGQCAAPNR